MLREFNGRQFTLFLETLTGIDNLIPDPYFIGGGIHLSGPGDFLKIHADFNWHHKLQAYRTGERAALPVRGVGRVVGRRDRVLGP